MNRNSISHTLRRIFADNYTAYRKQFWVLIGLGTISQLIMMCTPYVSKMMYQIIETKGDYRQLRWIAGAATIGLIVRKVIDLIYDNLREQLYHQIKIDKYEIYKNKLMNLDIAKINDMGTGVLLTKFDNAISAEQKLFILRFRLITIVLLRLVVIIGYFIMTLPEVLLVLIPIFIASYFLSILINKKNEAMSQESTEISETLSRLNVRFISENLLIRLNNKSNSEIVDFSQRSDRYALLERKTYLNNEIFYGIYYNIVHVVIFALTAYMGYQIIGGITTMSSMLILIELVRWIWRPIDMLLSQLSGLQKEITRYNELQEFINQTDNIPDGIKQYQHINGSIIFKNVSFGYKPDSLIFDKLNFEIQGGKTTAFVGHSGSGKSTLVKLLMRLYSLSGGEISVDGQHINELEIASLYRDIGYLTQDSAIFDGSVRENLMYGSVKYDDNMDALAADPYSCNIDDHIRTALEQAHLAELIRGLPEGLDTQLGERGVKLSGGEKQRLAIARIFLKNPSIIILDEPTSALDSVAESKITQVLNTLMQGRTIIVIAHRLQTVMKADNIIVMEKGQIIESGNHDSLMKTGKIYPELVDLQNGVVKE